MGLIFLTKLNDLFLRFVAICDYFTFAVSTLQILIVFCDGSVERSYFYMAHCLAF